MSALTTFLDRSTLLSWRWRLGRGCLLTMFCKLFFFVTQVVVFAEQQESPYGRLLGESIQLINSKRLEAAEQKLVDLAQNSFGGRKSDTWHVLSVLKLQQGRHEDGYEFSRKAIELAGSNNNELIPDYFSTGADHALKLGKTDECKALLETSIAKWPEHAPSLQLMGKVFQYNIARELIAKGEKDDGDTLNAVYLEAIKYYERYLHVKPHDHGVRNDLALLLLRFPDRISDGEKHFETAIAGKNIFAITNYASYLNTKGQREKSLELQYVALDLMQKSTDPEIRKHEAGLWNNLGSALDKFDDRLAEATQAWKNALKINPDLVPSLDSLANKISDDGDIKTANELLERAENAARRQGDISRASAAKFKRLTLLPRVYESAKEIFEVRAKFMGNLEELLIDAAEGRLIINNQLEAVTDLGYYLVYHGLHDQIARAHFYKVLCLAAPHLSSFTARHVRPDIVPDRLQLRMMNSNLSASNKIKVGFFSAFFREHSVGKLLRGIIAELSKLDIFDVILISPPLYGRADAFTSEMRGSSNFYLQLDSDDPIVMREAIAQLELDVLVYGELGMAHSAYFLSFSKLAHRTALFWGHGITSGNNKVDYFISSSLFETPYAQSHYVERLYLMPSICTYFLPPAKHAEGKTADDFGIPMNFFGNDVEPHLYLIPTSLYKLHPVMDEAISKLLIKDPLGLILIVEGKSSNWKGILTKRMSENMPTDVFERIIWMKPMKLPDYLAFIKLGAVIMFNYPIASGVTVMESLSVGTPYVVYEGHSQGSIMRLEKGYLTALELEDASCCIAYTVDDFVDKLYRFGNDKEFRDRISAEMSSKLEGRLYRNPNVVDDWIEFLHYISRNPQPEQKRLLAERAIVGGSYRRNV